MTRRMLFGWIALGLVIVAALVWIAIQLSAPDNTMSTQGWVALALGTVGTAAIAALLMGLLFRSSRSGHDR